MARMLLPPLAALRLVPLTPWHWRGAPAPFVADLEDAKRELGWEPAYSNVDALVDGYEAFISAKPAEAGAPHRQPLAGPLARLLRGR
jgi:nucleoside-diphosphate-sugar epimerase